MRSILLFAAAISVGFANEAHAQSLDIGGIELRLWQKVDDALHSLSSYQVHYTNGSWFVSQKVGSEYQYLGTIGARANSITFISKIFDLREGADIAKRYTEASRELRRRGGSSCTTREVEFTDGLVREIETQCGRYKLAFILPTKEDDGARNIGSISIILRAQ